MIANSVILFAAAALAEIAGAFFMWKGLREARSAPLVLGGAVLLVLYGLLVSRQPEVHFGRVLAAYGGVFVAGSLLWAAVLDGFRPDRFDFLGATVCLLGAALIMWSPR